MIDFKNLENIIRNNQTFLITTHVNPDADAIGSEMALYHLLNGLDKKVFIINYSSTPYFLEFLDSENVIEKFDAAKHQNLFDQVDVLFALDFNNPSRIVKMKEPFLESKGLKVCIDHHQQPSDFADHLYVLPEYAATGHILYDVIKKTSIGTINVKIAEALYAAIMTDTGSFRFDRTDSTLHRIIADLIDSGAHPTLIYDKIYDQSNFSRVKLLGYALSSIQLNESKEIAYMVITNKDLVDSGAEESDVDGFVNNCLSISGVKIGILFFELPDGVKISFRSKGKIPVDKLASDFNGGGHTNASGTRLFFTTLEEIVPRVLNKAKEYI